MLLGVLNSRSTACGVGASVSRIKLSWHRYGYALGSVLRTRCDIKACAGMVDAIDVEGDGGPGTVSTMKLNRATGDAKVFKTKVLARDTAARVLRSEHVIEGGEMAAVLKSQVTEAKVVPAGKGAYVAKITVEYERVDGAPLLPEDQAKLIHGYLGLIKKVEEYLVAHPGEVA